MQLTNDHENKELVLVKITSLLHSEWAAVRYFADLWDTVKKYDLQNKPEKDMSEHSDPHTSSYGDGWQNCIWFNALRVDVTNRFSSPLFNSDAE